MTASRITSGSDAASAPKLAITTPELVTFHYTPAGLASRAMAWLIDQVIIFVAFIAAAIALAIYARDFAPALIYIAKFLLDFGYFTLFEWLRRGQTPGKQMMGIAVAAADGAQLRGGDVLLRNLLRPIDGLPMFMTTGGIVAFIDPHRRRLGDMAAGTLVIRTARGQLPSRLFNSPDQTNTFWNDPAIRARITARITRPQRDLLMDLALRRDQLDPLPRQELFAQAHAYFARVFNLPQTEHLTDEQAVLNIAMVVRKMRSA